MLRRSCTAPLSPAAQRNVLLHVGFDSCRPSGSSIQESDPLLKLSQTYWHHHGEKTDVGAARSAAYQAPQQLAIALALHQATLLSHHDCKGWAA